MAIVDNPKTIDLNDIQGMVTRGYGKLFQTAYLMLEVKEAAKAKAWIKDIYPLISSGNHMVPRDKTLHLAFAPNGLKALGMNDKNLGSFPIAFREGMSTTNRNRVLGDHGINDPKLWRWGEKNDEHILLILHATDEPAMEAFLAEQKAQIEKSGLAITYQELGFLAKDNKEPFGFHDGISQPVIKGSGKKGPDNDIVETGEFLLGYKNEYGLYPESPLMEEPQGDHAILKDDAAGSGLKDFGNNGTFMVYRTMSQDVEKFWKAMENHTLNEDGTVNEDAKNKLAAKCVGRWPSGASLVNFPDKDPGGSHSNDDFGYADTDPDGLKCPFGSHLRRNNPRDTFRSYDKKQSLKISRRHRIIRRGRNYNLPLDGGQTETGLQFICFNTNIEMQFEFIQHAWANNNQPAKLSNDIDVVIGVYPENDPASKSVQFTVQNEPVNEFYDNWEQFVTIKGGSYYFFPSMTFLKYISTI